MPERKRPAKPATDPTADLRPVRDWLTAHIAELVVYGGLIATRKEVYDDALERTGSRWAADLFAFGPRVRVATPEDIASRPRLADIDRIIAEQRELGGRPPAG